MENIITETTSPAEIMAIEDLGFFKKGEEQNPDFSCDAGSGQLCCIIKSGSSGGGFWVWAIVLGILIILVVLGIIYRRKLQLMFFKMRSGRGRREPGGGRPSMPPMGMRRPMPIRRPPIRGTSRTPTRRTPSKTDKELDETLKKLKEISK